MKYRSNKKGPKPSRFSKPFWSEKIPLNGADPKDVAKMLKSMGIEVQMMVDKGGKDDDCPICRMMGVEHVSEMDPRNSMH